MRLRFYHTLLLSALFGIEALAQQPAADDDLTLHEDSIWFDAVTGLLMNLQRLFGLESFL